MICVTICTRERPKMLKRLLDSCALIEQDDRSAVRFIVIENGEAAGATAVVDDFRGKFAISYVNEPNPGLVFARNAAIEAFLATDAEWMASFDDDLIVDTKWLSAMLDAAERFPDCHAFAGPNQRIADNKASRWLPQGTQQDLNTGQPTWNVTTANALIHRFIFDPDKLGARFHSKFNFSGGEDTQFFFNLKDKGEKVLWVREAKCVEPTILERGSVNIRCRRVIARAQNWGEINLMRFGRIRGVLWLFWSIFASALNTLTYTFSGLIVLVFSENRGVAALSQALLNACHVVGYFKTLLRRSGNYYAEVEGY